MQVETKPFKILSIDGGGIRGVFPAMFLTQLEAELKKRGYENWQVHQHFDLICGTSTGGILAIALALGIPAQNLYSLYLDKAQDIFGNKRGFFGRLRYSAHNRDVLEELIRKEYSKAFDGEDPRLQDCKTNICVPTYDLLNGTPSVLKTPHHEKFTRDYHIPAYKAALATSAAPTYLDPYSSEFTDLGGVNRPFSNKVDGGAVANNPALLGIVEAQQAFGQELSNLRVLSLGTGNQKFTDGGNHQKWGLKYWMLKKGKKGLIIDLFMQGQSQLVENLISLMQNGIDRERESNPSFVYQRITTELNDNLKIEMDETNKDKLKKLAEKATFEFHNHANKIIENYCS